MAVVELLKIREEIDSFIETLEILKDKELLRDIEEAKKDIEEGSVISFDDLVKELGLEDERWTGFLREIQEENLEIWKERTEGNSKENQDAQG